MKHYSLLILLLITFLYATSQDKKIQADRPGETQTTETTPKFYIQTEVGFERKQQNEEDYTLHHPQLQVKYGLSQRVELRAEFTTESQKLLSKNEFKYGLKPVEIGFKAKLSEGKGVLPSTSIYSQVGIPPLSAEDHQTTHAIPKIRLLLENKLMEQVHLNYNIGAEWDGEETNPQWLYTIAPEIDLGEKWEAFVEVFGYIQKAQAPQHHLDGGFAYYTSTNFKLDAYGGIGLTKEAPNYFVSVGLSFRFKP